MPEFSFLTVKTQSVSINPKMSPAFFGLICEHGVCLVFCLCGLVMDLRVNPTFEPYLRVTPGLLTRTNWV